MRITSGRIQRKHRPFVKQMYNEVKNKFGFLDEDIVADMWRVLEDRESILKQADIFSGTLKEYQAGRLNNIFDAYYARSAYARFLKMMTESPHYPKDESQNESFFLKMWELLAELWKKNLPQMQELMSQMAQGGRGKQAKRERNNAAVDQMGKLIDYGQKVLELLKDPLFQKMFPPPPSPQPKGNDNDKDKSGASAEGESESSQSKEADGDGQDNANGSGGDGEESDEDGDEGSESPCNSEGHGSSSLDKVCDDFKRWTPYMVEGVLFSQDLKLVTQFSPKGKWEPTPFPDNSIDVHKIEGPRDLTRLLPSQYALPEDLFYLRYVKKELMCREFLAKQERKQILYILLDVSGSMRSPAEKVMMCASVVIALLRKVIANGDVYFLRFFDEDTSQLYTATNLEEAQKLVEEVIKQSFHGWDTRIHGALMTAINDIKQAAHDEKAHVDLKDAQILLLTDGQDNSLRPDVINAEKDKIKIHSVVLHCSDPYGHVRALSDTYREVNQSEETEGALNVVKLFDKSEKGGSNANSTSGTDMERQGSSGGGQNVPC